MKHVDRPRPLRDDVTRDKSRYCEFHDQHGHTTDVCWDLRDAIEKFIREGKLRRYVIQTQGRLNKRQGNRSRSPPIEKKRRDHKKVEQGVDDEFSESKYE